MEPDSRHHDRDSYLAVPNHLVRSVGEVNDGAGEAQGRPRQEGQAEEVPLLIYEEMRARYPHLEELP